METYSRLKVEPEPEKTWADYKPELTSFAWTILLPLLTLLLHHHLWNLLPNAAMGYVDPKVLEMPQLANESFFGSCRTSLICTMIIGTLVANNLFKKKSQSRESIVRKVAAASALLCITPAILMLYQVSLTFDQLPYWAGELVEKGSYPSTTYPLFNTYWYNSHFLLVPAMNVVIVLAIIIVSTKSKSVDFEEE